MKDEPQTLAEYFGDFIAQHRVTDGETFHLIVTDEDCRKLGEFFIRGIVGWACGVAQDRELQSYMDNSAEFAAKELQ